MGIVKRQAIVNSFIIYFGFGIGYLNVAFLFLQFFSPAQVGTKETLIAFTLLLIPLGLIGTNAGALKFFPKIKHYKKHGLLGFFFVLLLVFMSITFSGIFLLSDKIIASYETNAPLFASFFYLVYPLVFFFVSTALLESFCRSHLETYLPTFLREVGLRLITTFLILGYGFEFYDFSTFINLYTLSFGLSTIILICYLIYKYKHRLYFRRKLIKSLPLREILTFSGFSFMTSAATVFMLQVDKVMVSNIISEEATGVYALAIYLATLIEVPRRAITQTLGTIIAQAWKTHDTEALAQSYKQASINQQIIGSLLFSLLWINIDNIYNILPKGDYYEAGKYVVLFIGGSKLLDMIFGVNGELIGFSKFYKFNFYATIVLAFIAIGSNLYFINIYGMNGAALASFLSLFVFNVSKYFFIWHKFKLHAFTFNTLKSLSISLLLVYLLTFLPSHHNSYIDVIIKTVIFGGSYLVLTYYSNVSKEYNQVINKILKRV